MSLAHRRGVGRDSSESSVTRMVFASVGQVYFFLVVCVTSFRKARFARTPQPTGEAGARAADEPGAVVDREGRVYVDP